MESGDMRDWFGCIGFGTEGKVNERDVLIGAALQVQGEPGVRETKLPEIHIGDPSNNVDDSQQ